MKRIFTGNFIVFFTIFIMVTGSVHCQSYDFAATSGTFVQIVGGTNVPSIQTDDDYSSNIPIGFTFNYFGVAHSELIATSNGVLNLDLSYLDYFADNDLTGTWDSNLILPLWDDLSGSNGVATYITTGSSPNRIFTFEWLNWSWDYSSMQAISFQVKLYETSNKIEFIYRPESGPLLAPSASIGMIGPDRSHFYSLSGAGSSPTLVAAGYNEIDTKPAAGQTYSFTPSTAIVTAPGAQATNISISNNNGTTADITWTNGDGANRVVFIKQTTSMSELFLPVDNSFYPSIPSFDGWQVGSGWSCVYNGNGNSVTIQNLVPGDPYRVQVVEYNGLSASQKYLTSSAAGNPANFVAPLVAPLAPWDKLKIQSVNDSEMYYETQPGNGVRRAIFIKAGVGGTPPLVDNTTYVANSAFGAGSQVGSSGWYCIFNASILSGLANVTNLPGDTDYSVFIANYNGGPGLEKYNTTPSNDNLVTFHTYPSVPLPAYAFTASPGVFTAIGTGTPVDIIEQDEEVAENIPLGFTFKFAGIPFTEISASSNGNLSFNSDYWGWFTDYLNDLEQTQRRPLIAPLWDDLEGTGGSASYKTTGTAPNRVFTFEWLNWRWDWLASTAGVSFQVKLYETSNKIEFIYREEAGALSNPNASIGLAFPRLGPGNFLSLNNAGANPAASSSLETTSIDTKPATGQVYTFSPQKLDQSITFSAASKVFGDPDFQLAASASSGLPLQYTSSDPAVATISGNTVTILAAGSTDITASQPGDDLYNPAPPITITLQVDKASQTISFNSISDKSYGDAAFSLGATASSGLAVSYVSSDPTVATINGSTVTIVGVGSTTITASQTGNSNYNPAPGVNQTLTVVRANQTISFSAIPDKVLTDLPFDLEATSSSGLQISYASSNATVAQVSGATITIVGVGITSITASQPGNTYYNPAAEVVQTLTVKSPQTISFTQPVDRIFGEAPFAISASASSGLPISFTTTSPEINITGNVVTILSAGSVTIKAEQPGDNIYGPAAIERTFCIKPAKPTITMSDLNTEAPVLTSSAPVGNQWYKDGAAIMGATSSTHVVQSQGTYSVNVTIENCASVHSDPQTLIITSIEQTTDAVSVYPNPTTGKLYLNAEKFGVPSEIIVYNSDGKKLMSAQAATLEIDMSAFRSGLYIVRVLNGKQAATVKVFKK